MTITQGWDSHAWIEGPWFADSATSWPRSDATIGLVSGHYPV